MNSIRGSWLQTQYEESMAFAQRSSILSLAPVTGAPPFKYIAKFDCDGLVETADGIEVIDRHVVGIVFPEQYQQKRFSPGEILTWLDPKNSFHPNIRPPFLCVGDIPPGMGLMPLLHQVYQMITWQRFTPCEDDALNRAACGWARGHLERFPVDSRRSLLGATDDIRVDEYE
jgi:hypothetical protein